MDEELKLLIAHSTVLANEDLEDLKDSDIPGKFKDISLVKIYQGEKDFKSINDLIHALNLFFTYDVDLYPLLLEFLVNEYVLKLRHNAITSEEAIYPVMMDIKKKIDSEGLSNYLFTSDTSQLQPFDIFRSVELLSTATSHFQEDVFTSEVVTKGLSFLTSKDDIKDMFTHLKHYPFNVVYGDLVKASIDKDNVTLFDYLVVKYDRKDLKVDYSNYTNYSASKGSLGCLKYLHKNGESRIWGETTCGSAARDGHLNCLKYLHENGCPWDERTCEYAAMNGHLDCLKYAHENGCPWDKETCSSDAARGGNLDCLKYAHENVGPGIWDEWVCSFAAMNGHLDCLKYAHENGGSSIWNKRTCKYAAMNGHLDCLKYAHEHGCPWDEETCNGAVEKGHLECLMYAHENGCPCGEYTSILAAYYGHLDCLKFLHKHGGSEIWDKYTCKNASIGGHLDCLKYLHENVGSEIWNERICSGAAKGGNLECLQYAKDNGLNC